MNHHGKQITRNTKPNEVSKCIKENDFVLVIAPEVRVEIRALGLRVFVFIVTCCACCC